MPFDYNTTDSPMWSPMWLYFNTTDAPCDTEGDCDRTREAEQKAVAIFCILVIFFCCMLFAAGVFKKPTEEIVNLEEQTPTSVEDREKRKERISKTLVVKEWSSDGATVETETRQRLATKDDDRVTCGMGSDDYESFSEEQAVCAICLSRFEDHQLVCESNNGSCQHIFHKDCIIGWLITKEHCPMCREVYLLKTV